MNKVILMGRLTRDPEIRYTQNNMAVARFSIAIDRPRARIFRHASHSIRQPRILRSISAKDQKS